MKTIAIMSINMRRWACCGRHDAAGAAEYSIQYVVMHDARTRAGTFPGHGRSQSRGA